MTNGILAGETSLPARCPLDYTLYISSEIFEIFASPGPGQAPQSI